MVAASPKGKETETLEKPGSKSVEQERQTASTDAAHKAVGEVYQAGGETGKRGIKPEAKPEPKPETKPEVKPEVKPGPAGLPAVEIVQSQAPSLDQNNILKHAQELHEAIIHKGFFGGNNPDQAKIDHILAPLSQADRQALEKSYGDTYAGGDRTALRRDLKGKLDDSQAARAEAMLNRQDGRTNDAGAVQTALAQLKDNPQKANAELAGVFKTLNSEQIAKLKEDYKHDYGKDLDQTLAQANLSRAVRDSLPLLMKGSDQRSAEDIQTITRNAVAAADRELFTNFVSGDSPAAKQARQDLQNDDTFREKLASTFPSPTPITFSEVPLPDTRSTAEKTDRVILDYLQKGHIGLDTIANQNTGNLLFNNKDNLEIAVKTATTEEREKFRQGQDLAERGGKPQNQSEQDALNFYQTLNKAFTDGSSPREASVYRDNLLNGRATITTEMAKTHSDGWDPFGLSAGHNKQDLIKKAENLSQEDWTTLHDPEKGPAFRKQIEDSLKTYTNKDEREQIMRLLDDKAKASSYEASHQVAPSLDATIAENKSSSFLGLGTSYNTRNIAERIGAMSAEDAARFKSDERYRLEMLDFVDKNLSPGEQAYAKRMLAQVQETGQPAKEDAVSKILSQSIRGVSAEAAVGNIEKALQDPTLKERLNGPAQSLSPEDKQVKAAIESAAMSLVKPIPGDSTGMAQLTLAEKLSGELLKEGKLSPATKLSYGFARADVLPEIATAPEAQRKQAERFLSEQEKAIVDNLAKQNGKPDLADRMRTFIVTSEGTAKDFQASLEKLTPEQKQALKDQYHTKYGGALNEDFLGQVKGAQEQSVYQKLLTPGQSDGRQDLYDNYDKLLNSRSGMAADGTGLTVERANELYANALERYNGEFKKLSPDQQKAMNEFFGQALQQHKESKEKLAEILTDATLTAAAVAGAPFTAGLSTAALATVVGSAATAAGAYRIGVFKAVEGGDFDSSTQNLLKQGAIGFTSGALNLAGPELFLVTGKFASAAGTTVARELAEGSARSALKEGADKIIADEVKTLAGRRGFTPLTEQETDALVAKVARADASAAERQTLKEALEKSANTNLESAAARASEEIVNRGKLGRQVAEMSGISAGANAVSELVVAPFNEKGIDWKNLQEGALAGLAIGAVMPVGLRALSRAGKELATVHTNLTKGPEGLYIDPKSITEPVSFRNSDTGELRTIKPGEGEPLKLTKEWQPEGPEQKVVPISPDGKPQPGADNTNAKPEKPEGKPQVELNRETRLPLEPMTAKELKEVSTQIASQFGERSVTQQQFRELFDGQYTIGGVTRKLSEQERKLAAEVIEQSMPNLTSRGIDVRMAALKEQLEGNPNWQWQKRVDATGRTYQGANILVLDGSSDGNALAHLFQKNTGVVPTVKVLQGEELNRMREGMAAIKKLEKDNEGIMKRTGGNLDQVLNAKSGQTARDIFEKNERDIAKIRKDKDLDNAIIFDDVSKATPQQREVLGAMSNLAAADLSGFNRGPNIYDFAGIGMGTGTESMRGRVGEIIERAAAIQARSGVSEREAVRAAIDNSYSQSVRDLGPRANLIEPPPPPTGRQARDAVATGQPTDDFRISSLYQEITRPPATPEQIEGFLGRLSAEQQRLGAQMLRDGLTSNNYSDMVRQAKALQENILKSVPGGDPSKMLILTGVEENGSAYLTNSIYARANGLTKDNFVSVADLQDLAARKPNEALNPRQKALRQALEEKRLVYIDDYAYSNRQMPGLIDNLQSQLLSRLRGADGKPLVNDITVATLGRYELRENPWTDATTHPHLHPNGDQPYLRVTVADSPAVYKPVYDSPFYRQMAQDDRLRLQAWLGSQSLYQHSTIPTAMILPYGGPNNNVPWIQAFIESPNGLNLPSRYKNADWSEIEAGKPDFDRFRILGGKKP